MLISPLKRGAEPSSPPVSTSRRDDEASPGKNGFDPTKREPTHSPRTVADLKQEIREYEKRVNELKHEVTILQLKVRELEAKNTSHLACKLEAQSLRKDKEAAEALVAAYKDQLMLAKKLSKSRTPSPASGKKRRGGPEGGEDGSSKRQKP